MKVKQSFMSKILTVISVTIVACLFAAPNLFNFHKYRWLPQQKVNLGLDLKGGSHLLLQVDFNSCFFEQLNMTAENFRKELKNNKIGYKEFKIRNDHISLKLRDNSLYSSVKKILINLDSGLSIKLDKHQVIISFADYRLREFKKQVMERTMEIIRMRVDSMGTTEPIIQEQGEANIVLEVPGVKDPKHVKDLLGRIAKLTFNIVEREVNPEELDKSNLEKGLMLVTEYHNNREYFLLIRKQPIIVGDLLKNSYVSFNKNSQPIVSISFNSMGSKLFAQATKQYQGKRLAIILDGKLLSAPVITEPILGGSGVISGNFTIESANDLSLLLRSGALPTALKIIEEKRIGPNLGNDSIQSGKLAGGIGFVLVNIFMLWTYGVLGLFANIALILSLVYMLAILSVLQATLTLPGIAGIILTIGMAVDANVLIYERIKEELNKGSSILYSIREGFRAAFTTIADSNITTLLAAIVLYVFGTGAIKGFAVTLSVGILSSMYSAIVVTKLLIDLWVKYRSPVKLRL